MIEDLKNEIELIYNQKKFLSKNLFILCSYCKKRIIESIIEEIYCINESKCQECGPLRQQSTAEVVRLFEVLHLSKDMLPQQYFENRLNRKTLIAILNGIFTSGPKIPCTFPQTCSFELTYRCNLKCKHCYIGTLPNTNEMNTKTVLQIIEDIAETGFVKIALSGGEPLLRDDLLLIMKEIKNYDLEVILSTNGTLLSVNRVRELKSYIDLVCISLDSHEEFIHDNFRGVDGAQKMVLKGIKNCLDNDLHVRIFTTLTKFNHNKLPEFINFIEELGIREITLFDLNLVGKGSNLGSEVQLAVDEFKAAVNILTELTNLSNVKIDVLAPFNFHVNAEYLNKMTLLSGGFCNAGISTLNITPDGYIQPCSRLRTNLGNAKTEKIKEIWSNSSVLKKLRDRTKLKGMCGKCEYKYYCGGCRANAYSHYEDYLMEDLRCI
jgi:radical SAM protein with 4Fe4S-binding SPASM domain